MMLCGDLIHLLMAGMSANTNHFEPVELPILFFNLTTDKGNNHKGNDKRHNRVKWHQQKRQCRHHQQVTHYNPTATCR